MSTITKPVVKYMRVNQQDKPVVGKSHTVIPVDHPREHLNMEVCITSKVLCVYSDGTTFFTKSTKYVLA